MIHSVPSTIVHIGLLIKEKPSHCNVSSLSVCASLSATSSADPVGNKLARLIQGETSLFSTNVLNKIKPHYSLYCDPQSTVSS